MRLIKAILLVVLGLVGTAAALYVAYQRINPAGWKLPFGLEKVVFAKYQPPQLPQIPQQITDAFANAGKLIPQNIQSGNILGAREEKTEDGKPKMAPHQYAFEKARYEYCKGVVTTYEERYMSTPLPESTPPSSVEPTPETPPTE